MSEANPIKIHVSDYCLNLLDELQTELECESRSQLVEFLVLSQRHSAKEAKRLVGERPKRGRRWPAKDRVEGDES